MKRVVTILLASSLLLANAAMASEASALGWGLISSAKVTPVEKTAKAKQGVGLILQKKATTKTVSTPSKQKAKPTIAGLIITK
jgi:hypothetical protein